MALKFEELRVLQTAEAVADGIWHRVTRWDAFARDTVGKQMARAGDSIGANIAEAYGRFHYGEKLQFLYYARGSLFETKYWLNRAQARELMPATQVSNYAAQLTDLARQLNSFAANLKAQRRSGKSQGKATRESAAEYTIAPPLPLFDENDLASLTAINT
ncbi:MAG: four helix bundle protein [Anaerolineae bacterium]|jgi:four helix bundle protein